MSKLYLFLTPDGITYSSEKKDFPDVENLQVLGWSRGINEKEAFKTFLKENEWIFETEFHNVICIEIKYPLNEGKRFYI